MRVLVCGSREWDAPEVVHAVLDGLHASPLRASYGPEFVVISGAARGADSHAEEWVDDMANLDTQVWGETFPAEWEKYGKSAGYRRNAQMLQEGKPDLVVAFGYGKGTDMMVDLATKAGITTYRLFREGVPSQTTSREDGS